MNIWTYWEIPSWYEKRYDYIDMCIETMHKRKSSFEKVVVITPDVVDSYVDYIPDRYYQLPKAGQRADYLRLYLLKHYGGVWIDADTIIYRDLDILNRWIYEYGAFWYGKRRGSFTGVIGFEKGNPIINHMYKTSCDILESDDDIFWTKLGPNLFDKMLTDGISEKWFNIPKNSFYYYTLRNSISLLQNGDLNFLDDPTIIGCSLFNNRISKKRKWFYKMTKEEILDSKMVFSQIYNKVMQ